MCAGRSSSTANRRTSRFRASHRLHGSKPSLAQFLAFLPDCGPYVPNADATRYAYWQMRKHQAVIAMTLSAFAFVAVGSASAQESSASSEIRDADAQRLVTVKLEIRAKDGALVIPFCGSDEETYSLCSGAALLQVSSSHGAWRAAAVRKGLAATLGMMPKETWKAHQIDIGDTAYFYFRFSPDLLDVERGNQLRVVVDSWTSEAAMRANDHPDKRLTSPVVVCP